MSGMLKKWTGRNEFWVAATMLLVSAVIGAISPAFWSLMNL